MKQRFQKSAPRPAPRAFLQDASFSSLDSQIIHNRNDRRSSLFFDSKQKSASSVVSNARRLLIQKNSLFQQNKLLQIQIIQLKSQISQLTQQLTITEQDKIYLQGKLKNVQRIQLDKQTQIIKQRIKTNELQKQIQALQQKCYNKQQTIKKLQYISISKSKQRQLLDQAKSQLTYQLTKHKQKDNQLKNKNSLINDYQNTIKEMNKIIKQLQRQIQNNQIKRLDTGLSDKEAVLFSQANNFYKKGKQNQQFTLGKLRSKSGFHSQDFGENSYNKELLQKVSKDNFQQIFVWLDKTGSNKSYNLITKSIVKFTQSFLDLIIKLKEKQGQRVQEQQFINQLSQGWKYIKQFIRRRWDN